MADDALVSLLLAAIGSIQIAASGSAKPFDYSKSYTVWALGNDGSCSYAVYDVFVKRSDLKAALEAYQRKERGIEFLTTDATPAKCTVSFAKAASKAGFLHYRSRPVTDRDRAALYH